MRHKDIMLTFRCEQGFADWLDKSAEHCDCTRSEFIRLALNETTADDVRRRYFPATHKAKNRAEKKYSKNR